MNNRSCTNVDVWRFQPTPWLATAEFWPVICRREPRSWNPFEYVTPYLEPKCVLTKMQQQIKIRQVNDCCSLLLVTAPLEKLLHLQWHNSLWSSFWVTVSFRPVEEIILCWRTGLKTEKYDSQLKIFKIVIPRPLILAGYILFLCCYMCNKLQQNHQ